MDVLLGKVTQQAMNYAIRSGITMTAGYAIRQSSRLLKSMEGNEREELQQLQERLDSKIKIISPAIDMIELISARGNTSLESAVSLTKTLRWEIQSLGQRLATAANVEEQMTQRGAKTQDRAGHDLELKRITQAIRRLLTRIEDAVPLINLAITASGARLSSTLPNTVSPSRLLQASTFLTAGDSQYGSTDAKKVQVGPTFTLSLYMLFQGHIRPETEQEIRNSTWKEVIHKADVRLMRVPIDSLDGNSVRSDLEPAHTSQNTSAESLAGEFRSDEYAYQLVIVEDLDDDRIHTFEDDQPQPSAYGDIMHAGIRAAVAIYQLSKIFYADTGKILNIGSDNETNSPVLLLKRDINAIPPRRMVDRYEDSYLDDVQTEPAEEATKRPVHAHDRSTHAKFPDQWTLPSNLDPEWMAFEVYVPPEDSDIEAEADEESEVSSGTQKPSDRSSVSLALSRLSLDKTPSRQSSSATSTPKTKSTTSSPRAKAYNSTNSLPRIATSLSLLETLLRLTSLQQFQQTPHLSIPDELLTFFLSESVSTTGAAAHDVEERKRVRDEARRRVGFDPYDESPVKKRGEEYQYRRSSRDGGGWDMDADGRGSSVDGYAGPITPRYPSTNDEYTYRTRSNTPQRQNRSNPMPGTPLTPSSSQSPKPALPTNSSPNSPSPINVQAQPVLTRYQAGKLNGGVAGNRGSPLATSMSMARPMTGRSDEGLGTSPISSPEIEQSRKR